MPLPSQYVLTEFTRKAFEIAIDARGVLKFWMAFDTIDDNDNVTGELDLSAYTRFWCQVAGAEGDAPIATIEVALTTDTTFPGDAAPHTGAIFAKALPDQSAALQDAGLVEGVIDIFGADGDGDRQHIADGWWTLNRAVTRDFPA